jgi:hypothetical protein
VVDNVENFLFDLARTDQVKRVVVGQVNDFSDKLRDFSRFGRPPV